MLNVGLIFMFPDEIFVSLYTKLQLTDNAFKNLTFFNKLVTNKLSYSNCVCPPNRSK